MASPGSSGGGIFNLSGDLVGVFQAKIIYGPPFPPDGDLNIGIESEELLSVIKIYDVISNHRVHGTVTIGLEIVPMQSDKDIPGTYVPMPDFN